MRVGFRFEVDFLSEVRPEFQYLVLLTQRHVTKTHRSRTLHLWLSRRETLERLVPRMKLPVRIWLEKKDFLATSQEAPVEKR